MTTHFDHSQRVVGLNNLEAMCKRVSGTCHRFAVNKVTDNRVYVSYSNPDEYGSERPITAVLPAYPAHDNVAVVFHPLKFTGGRDEYDYQAFEQLWDCEPLHRCQRDATTWDWKTEYEILVERYPAWKVTSQWDTHGCVQTWFCNNSEFKSHREAQAYAVQQMRQLT